ncbi:MAG: hypothetical protein AAFW76_06005, partial [Pseudomonadota bacterium]
MTAQPAADIPPNSQPTGDRTVVPGPTNPPASGTAGAVDRPLLDCLVTLTRLFGRPASAESL